MEARLTDDCTLSSRRALDISKVLGFSGGNTFAEKDAFVANRADQRTRIQAKLDEFFRVAGHHDERMCEVLLSRAAASLAAWHHIVPNFDNTMVNAYLFDYCVRYGNTRT
jgi:hypothetical protein